MIMEERRKKVVLLIDKMLTFIFEVFYLKKKYFQSTDLSDIKYNLGSNKKTNGLISL